MKKVIVNADIMAMYKTLNSMKSRADLIAGDVDVFWANTMNLKTLKAQVDKISEVEQELVDSYFTEENSHSSFTFVQTLIKCIISSFYMCFVIDYPHNPIRS